MTKKQYNIYNDYLRAYKTTLRQCYGSWSWRKENAYNDCVERCKDMEGWDFRIISHNLTMFSVGWKYVKDNKLYFHYETNKTILDFEIKE